MCQPVFLIVDGTKVTQPHDVIVNDLTFYVPLQCVCKNLWLMNHD